ncbi:MAG: hypothetical protein NTX25_08595, partial [Proteobacteria bacterium]|nr:hypothetical protein [Pseudomonadota bacterium]
GGLEQNLLEQVIISSVGNCHPHLTFVLDCPVSLAMQRIELREKAQGLSPVKRNRYDAGSEEMHGRLRQAYQELAIRYSDRIVVINAENRPEVMVHEAMQVIERRFLT